jgi:drug/metabolite transporter (DMT)-like permease
MAETLPMLQIYVLMVAMMFSGTASTITQKLQNSTKYFNNEEMDYLKFQHPFFQTWVMFWGKLSCLPVFYITRWFKIRKYGSREKIPGYIDAKAKGLHMNASRFWMIIPNMFDVIGSTLLFLALVFVSASVYQMLKGTLVLIITVYSIIFLKRRFFRHHYTAVAIVMAGVVIVGASPLIYPDNDNDDDPVSTSSTIFGMVLEIVGLLFIGGNWISQEKLFEIYYLEPMEMVGWEGFWGTSIYTVIVIIFQFIPCPTDKICRYDTLEDSIHAFYEFGQNNWLWIFSMLLILWTALFNFFDVSVTKFASGAQRSTVDASRTAFIWLFFIIYQGEGHERFIWLQLVGFFMLIFGTLMHTEAISIPCFGFNKNTRKAIEAKKKLAIEDSDIKNPSCENQKFLDPNGSLSGSSDEASPTR